VAEKLQWRFKQRSTVTQRWCSAFYANEH